MASLYITEPAAKIRKSGGYFVVELGEEIVQKLPIETVEDITVLHSVTVSSQVLTECMLQSIPITWISNYGHYYGSLWGPDSIDIEKHMLQFQRAQDFDFSLQLSKVMILAKARNQMTLLKRHHRKEMDDIVNAKIAEINMLLPKISTAHSVNQLRGFEGGVSRSYFEALGRIVPESFAFTKRSKRPPEDPFNAMLGLGYSMLFNEVLGAVMHVGLHPYIGHMHAIRRGHAALVSDLMEEWRAPIIDSLCLTLIGKGMITLDHFHTVEHGCYLTKEGRKILLYQYNKKLRSTHQYWGEPYSYRDSIQRQCRSYASAMTNNTVPMYLSFEMY